MDGTKIAIGLAAAALSGAGMFLAGFPVGRALVLSLIVAILPAAWARRSEWKRKRGIEKNLANFLRDLSESVRAGMPVYQAIGSAAGGNYGELTPHIERMRWEILAGISFEEALERFADRAGSPRVERTVSLVLRASRAGGKVADVLEAASDRVRKHVEYSEKRRTNTNAYIAIAYVAFFVFLAVIYALTTKFFPAMAEASRRGASQVLPGFEQGVYRDVFFYLAVAQAAATGIFAGKVGEGAAAAGLKHAAILVGVALAFFFII